MIFWYLLISAPSPIYSKESQFECGDHGRFEYCIDGIPGCIIGCHCHPGYYFDTDTKICEPNSKLSQAYRRHISGEPTRIYHANSFEILETTTYFSTPNYDDHVDAIAQNTDDLGDWLYNQFFKTIEKQIINKTDNKVITRRSGKSPIVKTTKRKLKKVKKGSVRRKQKEDLRRKLLRITENDSLFDSDTDADTDTDTDADSSHSSSSDETHESKDKEHGHKKFVIVNKKPKPPLPSFIFLPNIETPFYPPVGLPPPVLPMFPMVPVPPVLPAPIIPNILPICDDTTTNGATTPSSTTQSESSSTKLVISTTEALLTSTTNSESSAPTNIESTTTVSRKRLRKKKMRDKNEMLRRLRELVQQSDPKSQTEKETKKPEFSPLNNVERDSVDEVDDFQIQPKNNNNFQFRANAKAHIVQQEDKANFKYLSELIHHLNETKNTVVTVSPTFQRLKTLLDLQRNKRIMNSRPKIVEPTRRLNYNSYTEEPSPETAFYTNLGKQIATLIRGVDTKYDRQIDIEIEHMNKNIPNPLIYNELNYQPNSYWERFARSPVSDVRRYEEDKLNFFNKGNEALYHLENKVAIAASTSSPMSLVELENVVNVIEKPLHDIEKAPASSKIKNSHNTLNINLWPQLPLTNPLINAAKPVFEHLKQYLNYTIEETTESDATSDVKHIPAQNNLNTEGAKDNVDNNSSRKIQDYTMERKSNEVQRKSFFPHKGIPFYKVKTPEKSNRMDVPRRLSAQIPIRRSNVHYASMSPLFDYNPKINFYNDNSQYPFYNNVPNHKLPPIEKSSNKQSLATPRSYFHRELHPFDFIE